jgi:hypothetical protein
MLFVPFFLLTALLAAYIVTWENYLLSMFGEKQLQAASVMAIIFISVSTMAFLVHIICQFIQWVQNRRRRNRRKCFDQKSVQTELTEILPKIVLTDPTGCLQPIKLTGGEPVPRWCMKAYLPRNKSSNGTC